MRMHRARNRGGHSTTEPHVTYRGIRPHQAQVDLSRAQATERARKPMHPHMPNATEGRRKEMGCASPYVRWRLSLLPAAAPHVLAVPPATRNQSRRCRERSARPCWSRAPRGANYLESYLNGQPANTSCPATPKCERGACLLRALHARSLCLPKAWRSGHLLRMSGKTRPRRLCRQGAHLMQGCLPRYRLGCLPRSPCSYIQAISTNHSPGREDSAAKLNRSMRPKFLYGM